VFWGVGRAAHPQEQFPVVVKVQLHHLGGDRQRDDHQRGINISVAANKWAESVGLVGEQVVCEQYVFGRLV